MNNDHILLKGLSKGERKRTSLFLDKLLRHFSPDNFAIVGGLAIRYHIMKRDLPYPERSLNDLDIIIKDINDIPPSVTKDFLIAEWHPPKKSGYFIVKLVDPETKIKADIFPFGPDSTKRFINLPFMGYTINVASIEDQLVKTVFDIQRISAQNKVDPKQFSDAKLLMKIADLKLANQVWKDQSFKRYPKSITDAIDRAKNIAKKHPEWLQEQPFRKPKPFKCPDCKPPADFPLTPMEEIYKILGYGEE